MGESKRAQRAFIDRLLEQMPEFGVAFRDHVDYHETVLPHVLMGDFTRWTIEQYRRAAQQDNEARAVLLRAFGFLESEYATDRQGGVQELISVSFLENLHQAGADLEGIAAQLGPKLRAELRRYTGWPPRVN
jgi:hypothetical protein